MPTKDHHDWVSATFQVDLTKYHGHDANGTDHTRVALHMGDSSPEVSELQTALHIKDTGVFDQATHDAVVAFQKANGLKADGVAGPRTLKALHRHHDASSAAPADSHHGEHHDAAKPGKLAHWMIGSGGAADMVNDDLVLFVVAEGDTDLTGRTAIISATPEGGRTSKVHVNIGPVQTKATKQQGAVHPVTLENLTLACPAPHSDAQTISYAIEAALESSLGGDVWRGAIKALNAAKLAAEPSKPTPKAHWISKGEGTANMVDDDLVLFVVADGGTDLSKYSVTVKVTPEGGQAKSVHANIGPVQTPASGKQGAVHPVTIENLTTFAPSPLKDGKEHSYTIEAKLEAELGGEAWHGTVKVRNMTDILDDHHRQQLKAHWIAKGAGTADMVDDDLVLFVVADGDGDLEGHKVVVKVTPEGGRTSSISAGIGKVQTPATAKMGAVYPVTIENLTVASKPPAGHGPTHTYNIEATLDAKLGGETWHGALKVLTRALPPE